MSDNTKAVADLEKAVADLTANLAAEVTKREIAEASLKAEVTKRETADKDEVLKTVDGVEVRKSAVGEAVFAIVKAQEARIAKAEAEKALAEVTKRVETEFGTLPGEAVAKATAFQALAKLPEAERATIETMLKSGEAALAAATTEKGSGRSPTGDANDQLEALAKAKAGANASKAAIAKAYAEVLDTDEGSALYAESLKAA